MSAYTENLSQDELASSPNGYGKNDVVVVVGGKEFQECSHVLCLWSGYFDKALNSGMKETKTLKFSFPDRNPNEWELIKKLVAPLSVTALDKSNVYTAVSWFDELCSMKGLEQCDALISSSVSASYAHSANTIAYLNTPGNYDDVCQKMDGEINQALKVFPVSVKCSLPKTKAKCCDVLGAYLEHNPFFFESDRLECLVSCLAEDEECCSLLWDKIDKFLPESVSKKPAKMLLTSDLLHELIVDGIRRKIIFDVAASSGYSACYKNKMQNDPVVGRLFSGC